jgi:hypothetical protein
VHVGHFRKRDKEDQRSTTELKDQKIKIREKKKRRRKKKKKRRLDMRDYSVSLSHTFKPPTCPSVKCL